MMEERILEIVFYLVQHARDHNGRIGPFKKISRDLRSLGFTDSEISSAYGWFLDELHKDDGKLNPIAKGSESVRVLSPEEMQNFTTEAAGFLIQLLQLHLLTPTQFERIIDKSFLLGSEIIDLPVIKVIASRYVFSSGATVDLNWFNIDDSEVTN
ncbi:MAG: DUF494 family protein [candidate division Zixibacteria bacterium]|nr:DUF494 family protein [candidate division Zixibacteria bacterium]